MCRFTIGQRLDRTFQLGLCRATRFSIGDGKRATAFLRDNPVYRGDAAESKIAARRALLISEAGVAMRVLIAGATGAIGRPLVRCLNRDHHSVFALARSPESSRAVTELGAEPVTADALDAAAVKAIIARVRPDAIINELTSLPRHYTPAEMRAAAERDRKVRIEGNANLLAALQNAGVRRYLLQSSGYWYAPAVGLAGSARSSFREIQFIDADDSGAVPGAVLVYSISAAAAARPRRRHSPA